MRTWLSCIVLSLAMSVPALAVDIRSGVIAWQTNVDGVTVPISPPVSGPNAQVFVQTAAASGYSPVSECTYFNVLKVTATQFEVQHKKCKDGTPVKTDAPFSMLFLVVKQ
jgi:hypothetical protein